MSEFFKSKGKFSLALGAVLLAITLAVGSFAYINPSMSGGRVAKPKKEKTQQSQPEEDPEVLDVFAPEEEQDQEEEPEITPVSYNAPVEMRGTFLVPGVDFLKTKDTTEATIKQEVEQALAAAKELDRNAIIVETAFEDSVIYQTKDAPELSSGFDILGYIMDKAKDEGFYTYAIFDMSVYENRSVLTALMSVGSGTMGKLSSNLGEFAGKYQVDGILLDGYSNDSADESYSSYLKSGGGIGFDNFMRQSPSATVKTASQSIRDASPGTQVGVLADMVWENKSANEQGSATEASYTSLGDGNADTKAFVEKGYVDFVAIKAYTTTDSQDTPFEEVVSWWADVALRNDVPLYVVHSTDKLFTNEAGWGSQDQLIRQLDTLDGISGVRGSIFNNLTKVSSNAQVVTNVKKIQEGEVSAEQVLTKLEITKPAQTTFTTSEPQVTFTGASDPAQPVKVNGEEVKTDITGYFTVQYRLKIGQNSYTFTHKDQTITYTITREVQILKEASPMGSVTTEGGMSITITAVAYEDASVYATVGGTTIPMSVDTAVESEASRDGSFRIFSGQFTAPAATGSEQDLGSITVVGEYEGEKEQIIAGTVKVNKKAKVEDGVAVRITADQAITYPPTTLDNIPVATYYPLPAGAMDYAVGDEIVYKKDDKTYKYYVLASGLRVSSDDLTAIADDYPSNNVISGLTTSSDSSYTYVTLSTAQKVSYSVSYAASGISFQFHNTATVPADVTLSKNPLFTSASWSGQTLTLSFVKSGAFLGYKGYYDNSGNLVLRFRNPPSSLSGARIAIDPGHGGADKGASGFLSDYPESVINKQMAQAVASELEARGATVNLMNNDGIEGEQRKQAAESWGADLFISIHANSSPNINATGTEVYYFHPFSQQLASNASASVSSGLGTNNRGAKQSYYHVTLSSQMPSVLIETGFLTNQGEYEKLIMQKYQKQIAAGIADALSATIKGTSTGISGSGSEGTGTTATPGNQTGTTTSGKEAQAVYLKSAANVQVGKTTTLSAEVYPDTADDTVTWKSSDTSVATVDENGRVRGVKAGTARITATTKSGIESSACTITVKTQADRAVAVTDVELNQNYLSLAISESQTLRATVYPDEADNTNVSWSSDNTSVATVNQSGRVTGVKEGTATITATTEDGRYKDTCTVQVASASGTVSGANNAVASDTGESISNATRLLVYEDSHTLNPRSSVRLRVNNQLSQPIKGSDFTWTSSDPKVATVDALGNVTTVSAGDAVITAKASKFDSQNFYITVTNSKIAVTGLSLSESKITLGRGGTKTLTVTAFPSTASAANVTWNSSDTKIATVDSSGNVTARVPGTATITVQSKDDSSIKATCTVEVTNEVASVSKDSGSSSGVEGFYIGYGGDEYVKELDLVVGDTGQLTYTYYPASLTAPGVVWQSYSPDVVTIDQSGNFRCVGKGRATIQIHDAKNSNTKTTCIIYVTS